MGHVKSAPHRRVSCPLAPSPALALAPLPATPLGIPPVGCVACAGAMNGCKERAASGATQAVPHAHAVRGPRSGAQVSARIHRITSTKVHDPITQYMQTPQTKLVYHDSYVLLVSRIHANTATKLVYHSIPPFSYSGPLSSESPLRAGA